MPSAKKCEAAQISPKSREVARSSRERKPASFDARVQSELRKLQRITQDSVPSEKRKAALSLLPNIAFLKVKLDDARREFAYEPLVDEYNNGGGQVGIRKHPWVSAYTDLLATLARLIKQWTDMMPDDSVQQDELLMYLNEETGNV